MGVPPNNEREAPVCAMTAEAEQTAVPVDAGLVACGHVYEVSFPEAEDGLGNVGVDCRRPGGGAYTLRAAFFMQDMRSGERSRVAAALDRYQPGDPVVLYVEPKVTKAGGIWYKVLGVFEAS